MNNGTVRVAVDIGDEGIKIFDPTPDELLIFLIVVTVFLIYIIVKYLLPKK